MTPWRNGVQESDFGEPGIDRGIMERQLRLRQLRGRGVRILLTARPENVG